MQIPADMTCVIEFIVEAEHEESYEQMDYKISHSVAYIASTEEFVKLTQDKLSDEEAANCYGDLDFIPDANI